jgi:hypothetical protein
MTQEFSVVIYINKIIRKLYIFFHSIFKTGKGYKNCHFQLKKKNKKAIYFFHFITDLENGAQYATFKKKVFFFAFAHSQLYKNQKNFFVSE